MSAGAADTNRPRWSRQLRPGRGVAVGTALLIAVSGLAASGSPAQAASPTPTTVQLSVWTGGFAPDWGSNGEVDGSGRRQLSDDGRYAVFSASGPILPGQERLSWQVVLRDRLLGTTTLLSRNAAGAIGNGNSGYPSISADGGVVAFHSYASNLVPGDTNGTSDVFTHDVATGATTRVSVTGSGTQVPLVGPGTNPVGHPTLSADGRWVGFLASAAGYTADDGADARTQAYLHDRATGAVELVSRASSGAPSGALAGSMVIPSTDGNLVSFYSGHHNDDPTVFVRDRAGMTTTGVPSGGHGLGTYHASADARFIVYDSHTGNLPAPEAYPHIFWHDRTTGATERVSLASDGVVANAKSTRPMVSNDGRYIAFESAATNLVEGDSNGQDDVFRHDRVTGQTIRVSVADSGGQSTSYGVVASMSADGQHVAFIGQGNDLTPVEISGYRQYFVRDLTGRYPALFARIGGLPGKVNPSTDHGVTTLDIRTGPALQVTWVPAGKGKTVQRSAAVSRDAFTLTSPKRHGKYTVTVAYAGHTIGTRTIAVLKPKAKKLVKKVKAGKRLKVRTVGVAAKKTIKVEFKPTAKRQKTVKRKAKVNSKGITTVKSPTRRGTYKVVVRAGGKVLRKARITVR